MVQAVTLAYQPIEITLWGIHPIGTTTVSAYVRLKLMKKLYKKASDLRAETWQDIGGIKAHLVDGALFVLLLIVWVMTLLIGSIIIAFDYLFALVLATISVCRNSQSKNSNESISE